jgi:hypothetical protein
MDSREAKLEEGPNKIYCERFPAYQTAYAVQNLFEKEVIR